MDEKKHILGLLKDEFNRWEALLGGMREAQIIAPDLLAGLSIKDVIAHLMAWQQRSNARLEAALHDHAPDFPGWMEGFDLDSEDDLEPVNARIHEMHRDRPWPGVHRDWREGFLRLLALAESIPEADLLETGKYPWLPNHPLAAVLHGTYDHHHEEHLAPLLAQLDRQE